MLASFDTQTQQDLQALLNGTGDGAGRPRADLNDAIGNLDPTVTDLSAMVGVLNGQSGDLAALIASSATVLTTLGDRSSDLQSLVTAGDQVLATTAARTSS